MIAKRWIDLVWYGVVSAAVLVITAPRLFRFLTEQSAAWHVDTWANYLWAGLLGALVWQASWARPQAFWGLKHFWSYPPLWVATVFGALSTALIWLALPDAWSAVEQSITTPVPSSPAYGPALLFIGFASVPWLQLGAARARRIVDRIRGNVSSKPASTEEPAHIVKSHTNPTTNASFDQLVEHLKHDGPIAASSEDLFAHSHIADRIARRLTEPSSVALVGELGSGKSSILRLTQLAIERSPRAIQIVPISLWPYESSDAAVKSILRAVIARLANEANVMALTGVPRTYQEVVEGMGGGLLDRFLNMLGSPHDPSWALDRIDAMACAMNIQLVLWVEDLERLGLSAGQSSSPEDRIAPIRSVLHLIDELRHVTVVLSSTTLRLRFDLEKIARFVERIPPIDPKAACEIIRTFRGGCLTQMGNFIDPLERDDVFSFNETIAALVGKSYPSRDRMGLANAVVELTWTPRRLKHTLRRCHETWRALIGEVDFDDLLLMTIVRECEPDVFALIDDFVHELRHPAPILNKGEPRDSLFYIRLDLLMQAGEIRRATERTAALTTIIEHIFGARGLGRAKSSPQSLRHAVYWQRFLAGTTAAGSSSDQCILTVIRQRQVDAVVQLLMEPDNQQRVEHFADQLHDDEVLILVEKTTDAVLSSSAANVSSGWPGPLVVTWRIVTHRTFALADAAEKLCTVLQRVLDRTVAVNLTIALAVEEAFVLSKYNILFADRSRDFRTELWKYMRGAVLDQYASKLLLRHVDAGS